MPAYNQPANTYLLNFLRKLTRRLTALEHQQNWSVRKGTGQVAVQGGLLRKPKSTTPSSPTYQITTPNTAPIYGMRVRGPTGKWEMVSGANIASATGLTYSSATAGLITGSPEVYCTVGFDGVVDVALGATINPGTHAGGETAWIWLSVSTPTVDDGAFSTTPRPPYLAASVPAGSTFSQTCFGQWRVTGLAPGKTASFKCIGKVSSTGTEATYDYVFLSATPI